MVALLNNTLSFPDVEESDPDGIVAFGGDLSVERLITAYRHGIFPWYCLNQPIIWWSPDPRGIIPLDGLYINKTLRKVINRDEYTIKRNTAFEEVINNCANMRGREKSGWIIDKMISAYINLHRAGYAHSVEVWRQEKLVGGLYGVAVGGLFAGESMFYIEPNCSKLALVGLVEHLKLKSFYLLDCQMVTNVTSSMGGVEIPRAEYIKYLKIALTEKCSFI